MRKRDELAYKDGLIEELDEPDETTVKKVRSITDPDSGLLGRPHKPSGFHYLNHQTIDGHSGIITDVYVTAGYVADNVPHTEKLKYQIGKFGFHTKEIGADGAYDSAEVHAEMLGMKIKTYIPAHCYQKNDSHYSITDFTYHADKDVYICPNGCELKYKGFRKGRGVKRYKLLPTSVMAVRIVPDIFQASPLSNI
jgi:hypothetical protein